MAAYRAGDVASLLDALALSTAAGFHHAAHAAARTLFEQRFDARVVYQQYIDALLKMTKTEHALPA